MPKPRLKINAGLPGRWVSHHGAYYYRVPPGLEAQWDGKKKFLLGHSLPEAYKAFAARVEITGTIKFLRQAFDKYLLEVVPTKAPATQQVNVIRIKRLRSVFGAMPVLPFPPKLVYKYYNERTYKSAARSEIALLSHVYTKLVEWGEIDEHPFKGEVQLEGDKPRDRYVEDWEVLECLALPARGKRGGVTVIQAYIRIKLLTGMSRGDLLLLEPARHFTDEGIFNQRHKTANSSGQKRIYEWTPALRAAVAQALAARPVDISPYLFCTRKGKCYINEKTGQPPGWKSMWQRFIARVLQETKVSDAFHDHDLRAKVASDADTLEHAATLLAHADSRTTERIYRRKAIKVRPMQ